MPSSQCAHCGTIREGQPYEYRYGILAEERVVADPKYPARTATAYRYDIYGTESAFICDICVAERLAERRRQRTVEGSAWGFAMLLPGVILALLIAGLLASRTMRYGSLAYAGLCTSVFLIIGGAFALRSALSAPNAEDRQEAGETLAIGAGRSHRPAHQYFWTSREYNRLGKPKTNSSP